MPEENIIIKHLQAIRSDVADIKERMGRVKLRLSTMEQHMGAMLSLSGSDRERIESLASRLERVERRLELRDDA